MKLNQPLTRTDLIITLLIITFFTLLITYQNNKPKPRPTNAICQNNLKQIALTILINNQDNPTQPTQQPNQTPNWHNNPNQIWKHYAQIANTYHPPNPDPQHQLNPQILICPTDKNRIQPTTWQTNQPPNQPHTIPLNTNQNLSYLLTLNPNLTHQPTNLPLAGDRNITGPQRPNITQNTILQPPHTNLTYDKNLHKHRGNTVFADGHTEHIQNPNLPKTLNQLQHPIALPGNHPPTNP